MRYQKDFKSFLFRGVEFVDQPRELGHGVNWHGGRVEEEVESVVEVAVVGDYFYFSFRAWGLGLFLCG